MPKVDPKFITHKLNVDPSFPLKKQKLRRSTKQRVEAVKQEVEKLKQARAIKEVFFPKWLFNIMVVKKKNGKWKVCVDFTDQPGMSKRFVFDAEDQLASRCYVWAPKDEFSRCFPRLPLDCSGC